MREHPLVFSTLCWTTSVAPAMDIINRIVLLIHNNPINLERLYVTFIRTSPLFYRLLSAARHDLTFILRSTSLGGERDGSLPGLFLAGYRPFESITVRARLNNRGPVSNAIQEPLHSRALGKTCVHSEKGRLVVMTKVARSAHSLMT
jgi:hypothetical protein